MKTAKNINGELMILRDNCIFFFNEETEHLYKISSFCSRDMARKEFNRLSTTKRGRPALTPKRTYVITRVIIG